MQLSNNCVNKAFPPRRASAVISNMHFPMQLERRGMRVDLAQKLPQCHKRHPCPTSPPKS